MLYVSNNLKSFEQCSTLSRLTLISKRERCWYVCECIRWTGKIFIHRVTWLPAFQYFMCCVFISHLGRIFLSTFPVFQLAHSLISNSAQGNIAFRRLGVDNSYHLGSDIHVTDSLHHWNCRSYAEVRN